MDFAEKYIGYILQCATCKAIEIAENTGRFGDIEDFKQEIILWIVRRSEAYNPQRGRPSTYISLTSATAKKRIMRKLNRAKNRMIRDAIPL